MKDAYYFPHDSNASEDPKIQALISKYGFEGYGRFWRLIELLRNQPDYKYPINKWTYDTFARVLLYDRNTIVEFINDLCHEFADEKSALLCMDDKSVWSESLIKRMKNIDDRREKARQNVRKRWDSYERNTDVIPSYNELNTVKESKVKKSKVNKNIYAEFVSLSEDEYQKLVQDHGQQKTNRMIEILNNYKGASGKKYKSDYLAILNWVVQRVQDEQPKPDQYRRVD